jgi:RNA polymerase sigma factor (sigma-70 family)
LAAVEAAAAAGATTQDLYSQYSKQIYSYCLHKLRSREEAEDAVQTTFMNAFRSLQRGATTQFEQAWLFKIAQNVCFARQSSSSKRLRLEAPNDFDVLQEIVPAREGEQPLELMGLGEALEQMPENQRRAILMREWQGLSYREISDELDLSQAAVEMLIFRARRALAGALEEPQETREKKLRAGRKVGALGSLLGALKTLFGGGAAIKAVSLAAAAIAVVGESANHTIVHHPAAARAASASAVAARASAPATSRAHFSARGTSAVAGLPAALSPVTAQPHAVGTHAGAQARSADLASRARSTVHPRPDKAVVAAAAPPIVVAPTPAPAPVPAAAPAAPPAHQDPPEKDERRTTSVVAPEPVLQPSAVTVTTPPAPVVTTAPGNGDGNAYGRNKNKGDSAGGSDQSDPPQASLVTAPAVPAPVATAAAPQSTPPAPDDHGNGPGTGNGRGHSK